MQRTWLASILIVALLLPAALAGEEQAAPPVHAEQITDVPWLPIHPDLLAHMQAQDWPAVVTGCEAQLEQEPHNGEVIYQLACAQARLGKAAEAVATLDRARRNAFDDADRTNADADLASLHGRPDFDAVLARMRLLPAGRGAPLEPADPVPGMRCIEGDGGGMLHYRLFLPSDASLSHPYRLVVWMHPSGGSGDSIIERLAPDLARHGCCLVLFPKKQYVGWLLRERHCIPATIAAIARQEGVDARKPILMGYSAGGQTALQLWDAQPQAWGGLILDAAYPLDTTAYLQGKAVLMNASSAALAARTPMLAVIGSRDGNMKFWDAALQHWPAQSIQVITVPNAGHQFLLVQPYWPRILAWMEHPGIPVNAPTPVASAPTTASGVRH